MDWIGIHSIAKVLLPISCVGSKRRQSHVGGAKVRTKDGAALKKKNMNEERGSSLVLQQAEHGISIRLEVLSLSPSSRAPSW